MERQKTIQNLTNSTTNQKTSGESTALPNPDPSPSDLEVFLPWAAIRLELEKLVFVSKIIQAMPVPVSKKEARLQSSSRRFQPSLMPAEIVEMSSTNNGEKESTAVHIAIFYIGEDLVHIQFQKTIHLPREILILIALILDFHPLLNKMTFKCGIDQYTLYELHKILTLSIITEVYLDDTFVKEANYAILLEKPNSLQVLSLARCKLGDDVTKEIASKLHYPLPASKVLCTLTLSSNSITDRGAKYLAAALRSNRKLSYLNIASNKITDSGGEEILKVLVQFPLTTEEQLEFKQTYMRVLKQKQLMIENNTKNTLMPSSKHWLTGKNIKTKKLPEKPVEVTNVDSSLIFDHPMSDSTIIDDLRYSNGNSTLTYLNVAYNRLSYEFVKQLVKVVENQQFRKMKLLGGLAYVRLEGNPMPENCPEYDILDVNFERVLNQSGTHPFLKKNGTGAKKHGK